MKTRVLTEKVLAEEEVLTELVVYFPENGVVARQHKDAKDKVLKSEILVRLVYADEKVVETILEALKKQIGS